MQIDHLRFILEIARQGSINKAAESLRFPRSHLSRILSSYEENLGTVIFERLPRGVRPTEEGQYVLARLEEALGILGELDNHFKEQAPENYPSYTDQINFYCPPVVRSRGLISIVFEEWQNLFPNAQLIQRSQEASDLIARLEEGESLALVTYAPAVRNYTWTSHTELRSAIVAQSEIVALVHPSHPLAGNKSISLKALCKENLLLVSPGDDSEPSFVNLLLQYGVPNIKRIITGNPPLFYNILSTGQYVSIGAANQFVNDGLVEIPIKEKITVNGMLIFHPRAMNSFPLRTLVEILLQYYDQSDLISTLTVHH